jgi:hypothetical protein
MNEEMSGSEKMLLQLASHGGSHSIRRLALIVQDSRASHMAQVVRTTVPTCAIGNLEEFRTALREHFINQNGLGNASSDELSAGVMAFDITHLPVDETSLFASHLRDSSHIGAVYILTPEQHELFDDNAFDFTVR